MKKIKSTLSSLKPIVIIVGASLTGKSHLQKKAIESLCLTPVLMETNRQIRDSEVNGKDYTFTTEVNQGLVNISKLVDGKALEYAVPNTAFDKEPKVGYICNFIDTEPALALAKAIDDDAILRDEYRIVLVGITLPPVLRKSLALKRGDKDNKELEFRLKSVPDLDELGLIHVKVSGVGKQKVSKEIEKDGKKSIIEKEIDHEAKFLRHLAAQI